MKNHIQFLLLLLTLLALSNAVISVPAVTYTTTITENYTTRILETIIKTSIIRSAVTMTFTTIFDSTSTTYKLAPTPQMIILVKTLILPMMPPKTVYQPFTTFILVPTTIQSEVIKTYTSEIVKESTISSSKFLN